MASHYTFDFKMESFTSDKSSASDSNNMPTPVMKQGVNQLLSLNLSETNGWLNQVDI